MAEPRFTGTMVEQHLAFLRSEHGAAAVDAALGAIAEDMREELVDAMPVSWVRVEALDRFYQALAEQLGRPVAEIHEATVDHCTKATFNTLWRALLRLTTDRAILARAPVLYKKTYDTGELHAEIDRPGHAICEIRGWPGVPDIALRGLRVGIANVLRVAGREHIQSRARTTPDGARFELEWDG